jgi:hypothetical protein
MAFNLNVKGLSIDPPIDQPPTIEPPYYTILALLGTDGKNMTLNATK